MFSLFFVSESLYFYDEERVPASCEAIMKKKKFFSSKQDDTGRRLNFLIKDSPMQEIAPYTPFDRIFQSCGRYWHIRRADMEKLWTDMGNNEIGEDRLPGTRRCTASYWNSGSLPGNMSAMNRPGLVMTGNSCGRNGGLPVVVGICPGSGWPVTRR